MVNGLNLDRHILTFGTAQGSVLDSILLTLYTRPLVENKKRNEHVTPLLKVWNTLHWLPIKQRVFYKLMTLYHKRLFSPNIHKHFSDMPVLYVSSRHFRFSDDISQSHVFPQSRLISIENKASSCCAPKIFNPLPKI